MGGRVTVNTEAARSSPGPWTRRPVQGYRGVKDVAAQADCKSPSLGKRPGRGSWHGRRRLRGSLEGEGPSAPHFSRGPAGGPVLGHKPAESSNEHERPGFGETWRPSRLFREPSLRVSLRGIKPGLTQRSPASLVTRTLPFQDGKTVAQGRFDGALDMPPAIGAQNLL